MNGEKLEMMTLEQKVQRLSDIEDIKQLKARYAAACDDDYNADVLASLFTESAIWDGGMFGYAEGREAIRDFFNPEVSPVPFAIHQISNPQIELSGDVATGKWYLWQPMVLGEQALWMSATYEDLYVRQGGEWLYQSLKLNVRMLAPYEEGFSKTRILELAG